MHQRGRLIPYTKWYNKTVHLAHTRRVSEEAGYGALPLGRFLLRQARGRISLFFWTLNKPLTLCLDYCYIKITQLQGAEKPHVYPTKLTQLEFVGFSHHCHICAPNLQCPKTLSHVLGTASQFIFSLSETSFTIYKIYPPKLHVFSLSIYSL